MGMLEGQVALITGGARGQGRAHATTCAREGADVILIDSLQQIATVAYPMATQADMAETVRAVEALGRRAHAVTGDVRNQADLDRAVAEGIAAFGRLDILIANAGIHSLSPAHEMTEEMWDDMIAVNLTGAWKSIRAVLPHMIQAEHGSIVMTSSMNGLEPGPNYAHYVSAKFGLVGLMKAIALEYAPHGIRANTVHPGAVLTPMTNWQGMWDMIAGKPAGEGTEEEFLRGGYSFHALRGVGYLEAQRIADAALWLNSDLAARVTGITVPVDAGHLLQPGYNPAPVIPA